MTGSVLVVVVLAVSASSLAYAQPGREKTDPTTRTYDIPPDKVFIAAAQVAAQKWNVTHSDKDIWTVSFKTGANMRTWRGFEVSVACIDLSNGRTKVQLHPQKRPSGQLFSWKEGGRIASQFYEALEVRLRDMELLPDSK